MKGLIQMKAKRITAAYMAVGIMLVGATGVISLCIRKSV